MKLSIIIVSWNVKDDLSRCLASLKENRPSVPFEVIVIDNRSSDGTVNMVRQEYPDVVVIGNHENKGFARANNQGIKQSRGQHVLLLNPDTIVPPGSLDRLVAFLGNNPDVGACGPKLLNADGSTQASVRRFPTYRAALYNQTICRVMGLFRSQYRKWMMKDFGHDRQMDVDQIMGAAMLIRRSVIDDVGGMDENFFMYYEEVDLCYRIKKSGRRIVFFPGAVITHLGGRSSSQVPLKRLMVLTSLVAYFRKHRGKLSVGLFAVALKIGAILRHLFYLITGIFAFALAFVRGDRKRKRDAMEKIKLNRLLLMKYTWRIITL